VCFTGHERREIAKWKEYAGSELELTGAVSLNRLKGA